MSRSFIALFAVLLCVGALAACSGVDALNALTPRHSYVPTLGLAYGSDARQRLDVYAPLPPAPPKGWPMVVFFYGGSWNSGDRGDYRFVGEALAARGMVAVVADYRLYPLVRYPDFLADSAQAVAWSLSHAASLGADPKRVFVMGHSAGGYNAAEIAIDSRWLAAAGHSTHELAGWIGLAGAYDFLPTRVAEVQPVFHAPDYPTDAMPVDHVTPDSPPAFLGVAANDRYVDPHINTDALIARLDAAGVPHVFRRYEHVNHMTLIGAMALPLRFLSPVLDDVSAFVNDPSRTSLAPPR
jgi:acetyl esterase/lipase